MKVLSRLPILHQIHKFTRGMARASQANLDQLSKHRRDAARRRLLR